MQIVPRKTINGIIDVKKTFDFSLSSLSFSGGVGGGRVCFVSKKIIFFKFYCQLNLLKYSPGANLSEVSVSLTVTAGNLSTCIELKRPIASVKSVFSATLNILIRSDLCS